MLFRNRIPHTALTLAAFSALAFLSAGTGAANAVVYCKTVGIPQGCIVRPAVRTVVVAPVVVAPVVVAPRVGVVGVGRVGAGAVGVPGNRGGPVNRVGRR